MSWIGGKKALRELIVRLFPLYYERYIEVFGGGGWVLFHKPPGNDFEVYVVIDCGSYIANDILSAVALMEADSVLRLANADLKSISYLSSQLPLLRDAKWDTDKQYKTASNVKPQQAGDHMSQALGTVAFTLPHSAELEGQYLAGNLLADLSMKDSRVFRKEIEKIAREVFGC